MRGAPRPPVIRRVAVGDAQALSRRTCRARRLDFGPPPTLNINIGISSLTFKAQVSNGH
jgi:hypothetical protein